MQNKKLSVLNFLNFCYFFLLCNRIMSQFPRQQALFEETFSYIIDVDI